MGQKKLIKIIGAAVVAVAVGVGAYSYYEHKVSALNSAELTLAGNVDVREVSVAFRASDRIAKVLVEEGVKVQEGQVLAILDNRELALQLNKVKSQIAVQQATVDALHNGTRSEDLLVAEETVNEARASSTLAQQSFARMEALYKEGAISSQEYDKARANYDATKAKTVTAEQTLQKAITGPRAEEIAGAEANLQALKDELARQEYVLSEYELKAPANGIIRSRLLEPGDMASPAKPVFKLSILDKKWVRAYVSETELVRIFEGQEAQVYMDGQDSLISGQVGYISNTAEFTPKTVQTNELRTALVYEVRIYVDDPDNLLRMGMPVTVKIKR